MLPVTNEPFPSNKLGLLRNVFYVLKVMRVHFSIIMLLFYFISKFIWLAGVHSTNPKPLCPRHDSGFWGNPVNKTAPSGACPQRDYILLSDPRRENEHIIRFTVSYKNSIKTIRERIMVGVYFRQQSRKA